MEQVSRRLGPSRFLRTTGRSLLLLLFVALGLGVVELMVWTLKAGGEARRDAIEAPYMPIRLKPLFSGLIMDQPIRTNRFGFRDPEDYPVAPPRGELRIMGVGDSVAFGMGLSVPETFLEVAEKRLRESYPAIRVVNAAGQGYSPSSYHAYLAHEGLDFRPQLVVVPIELCNDVSDEALLRGPLPRGDERRPRVRGGRYVISWDGNLLGSVILGPHPFEKTYAYTFLLRRALTRLNGWFPGRALPNRPDVTYFHLFFDRVLLDEAAIEAGWQRLFAALEATHQLLQANRIPMLLLILPSRHVFLEESELRRPFARGLLERAAAMAREHRIPFLEVHGALEDAGGASLFFDFAHLTAEGNRLIGEILARHISAMDLQIPD